MTNPTRETAAKSVTWWRSVLRLVQMQREPLSLFIGWRLALGMLPFFAWVLFPAIAPESRSGFALPSYHFWAERLLVVWGHWDGEWFLKIAEQGYHSTDDTLAFFPLYPLLVKLLGFILLNNNMLAAVILSSGLALAALLLLYTLVLHDYDKPTATRATMYLAAFPTAFFLCAVYSESLFLALVLGSFVAARHWKRWWLAGVLAALAALTRNIGVFLVLPLLWEWWQQHRTSTLGIAGRKFGLSISFSGRNAFTHLLPLILPPLALLGWLGYVWAAFGSPFAIFGAQSGWDRNFRFPWNTIIDTARIFFTSRSADGFPPPHAYWEDPTLIDFPFFVFATLLLIYGLWLSWRGKMPFSYIIFMGIGVVFPLLSPAQRVPLLSYPRFALVLFPLFLVLALLGNRWRWFHYTYLYSSLLLLALFLTRFVNWYWIA
jgi:hypothetical protein